jgi:hypothetical protein
MKISVEFGDGTLAECASGVWTCEADPFIAFILNESYPISDARLLEQNPEQAIVDRALAELGGQIIGVS